MLERPAGGAAAWLSRLGTPLCGDAPRFATPENASREPQTCAAGPGRPKPPSAKAFSTWLTFEMKNGKGSGAGSIRPRRRQPKIRSGVGELEI